MTDALTDSPFRHAASATLKHILEKESRHITRADLEQRCIGLSNLSATMLSAIAFRPRFLKHEPAKNAMGALHRRQNKRCHDNLREFRLD